MGNETEIVFFNHGGRKVSNDPRWQAKASLKKKKLEMPVEEDPRAEETTVIPQRGELATPEDQGVEDNDPNTEDKEESEDNEESDDDESEDDEDEPVEGEDYSDFTGKALKNEVAARHTAGRVIDTKGVTTKAELIALLKIDDAAQAEES